MSSVWEIFNSRIVFVIMSFILVRASYFGLLIVITSLGLQRSTYAQTVADEWLFKLVTKLATCVGLLRVTYIFGPINVHHFGSLLNNH